MGLSLRPPHVCAMRTAHPYLQVLSKLILVIFLVVHAPIAGVMNAAQAFAASGEAGPAGLVICTQDGFKRVATPDGTGAPEPGEVNGHECLCPCATLCGSTALPAPTPGAALLGYLRQARQIIWPARTGLNAPWLPHSGQGHPRAPPASIV